MVERRSVGQGIALLFIDLDDFKRINDTLGHDAGDDVLIEFSGRLKSRARRARSEGGTSARAIGRRRVRGIGPWA
jgi:diguanylate cyclase (GGDEF)-like protein